MSGIAPGWYKDPAAPETQRYWDGEGWIGEPLPADVTPPPGPPPSAAPEPPAVPAPFAAPAPPAPPLPEPRDSGTTAGTADRRAIRPPADAFEVPVGGRNTAGPGSAPPAGPPPAPAPAGGHQFPYRIAVAPPRLHGLTLAPPGLRLLARLIDIGVVLLLNAVVNGWFVWLYIQELMPIFREALRQAETGQIAPAPTAADNRLGQLQIVILLIATALWFAYEVPAVANSGQTLGKRLLGLRVVRLDSEETDRLGFGRSLRRWNTLGLPTLFWFCCVGFVLQFIDCLFVAIDRPLHQALHDKSARTVVVLAGRPARPATKRRADDDHPGGS